MTMTAQTTRPVIGNRSEQQPERLRTSTPPAAGAGTAARVVVVGTAIKETVRHGTQGQRHGIGGVAGNMAEALAWAGNPVTLVASIGRGPAGQEAVRLLTERNIRVEAIWSNQEAGYGVIETRNGEQGRARGRWPMPGGLWRLVDRLDGEWDAIASDAHMGQDDLRRVLERPGKLTLANGTSARAVIKIMNARVPGLDIAALNAPEMDAVLLAGTARPSLGTATEVRRVETAWKALRVRMLLATGGARGWTLIGPDGAVSSEAAAAPPRTDFVGCGDWAAAGALHAMLHGLEPEATINDFIGAKLRANVVEPKSGRR